MLAIRWAYNVFFEANLQFGGPSLNYMNSGNANKEFDFERYIWKQSSSTRLQQIYVGYQVGIQCLF